MKKLYVLAALEVDQLKARMLNIGEQTSVSSPSRSAGTATGTATAAHTLAGEDTESVQWTSAACLISIGGPLRYGTLYGTGMHVQSFPTLHIHDLLLAHI